MYDTALFPSSFLFPFILLCLCASFILPTFLPTSLAFLSHIPSLSLSLCHTFPSFSRSLQPLSPLLALTLELSAGIFGDPAEQGFGIWVHDGRIVPISEGRKCDWSIQDILHDVTHVLCTEGSWRLCAQPELSGTFEKVVWLSWHLLAHF